MVYGWKYRGAAVVGTVLLALGAGFLGSYLGASPTFSVSGTATLLSISLISVVISILLVPLYTPRPRSVATILQQTGKQLGIACVTLLGLSAVGIATAPGVLTTAVTGALLFLTLPVWYVVCRRYVGNQRVLVIGNNPEHIRAAIQSAPAAPVGFLSPALADQSVEMSHSEEETPDPTTAAVTDGGIRTTKRLEAISGTERIGGLSQFPHVLHESDIDTVVLAFERCERTERFGTLRICREHNVNVLIRDSLATQILTTESVNEKFSRVDLHPWPWYGRLAKRLFDLVFATIALVVTAPLLVLIAVAIKLDSPGPILYGQRRTARLGGTFSVWKFRSMLPESEDANPGSCRDRITPVGHVLRKTHLDEIPQLLSILTGNMSVVGPRPVWTEEERLLREDIDSWSKRWAVTPGLTGLAQIRDIDSTDAEEKLRCDLEYIEKQSMRFDLRIVVTQLWQVATDSCDLLTGQDPRDESSTSSNEQTD